MSNSHALFSRAVAGLYCVAERASYDDCPVQSLEILRQLIQFDVALLGESRIDAHGVKSALLAQCGFSNNEAPCTEPILAALRNGPALRMLRRGIAFPLQAQLTAEPSCTPDWIVPAESPHATAMHALALGDNCTCPGAATRWIVLCRDRPGNFSMDESLRLCDIWRHLLHSVDLNRRLILLQESRDRSGPSALVSPDGEVLSADAGFGRLLGLEWRAFEGRRLPYELVDCLQNGRPVYHGRAIQVRIVAAERHAICHLSRIAVPGGLSRSEHVVAERFASGASHKTIARELGVSPHTVRNQIAHLYGKLGIHNKAELVRHVLGRQGSLPEPEEGKSSEA